MGDNDLFGAGLGVLFADAKYPDIIETVMRAEHNRWWTERLLAGWVYDESLAMDTRARAEHQDKKSMRHGDMVPFENLSGPVKDKDKINIAAMAVWNFIV